MPCHCKYMCILLLNIEKLYIDSADICLYIQTNVKVCIIIIKEIMLPNTVPTINIIYKTYKVSGKYNGSGGISSICTIFVLAKDLVPAFTNKEKSLLVRNINTLSCLKFFSVQFRFMFLNRF